VVSCVRTERGRLALLSEKDRLLGGTRPDGYALSADPSLMMEQSALSYPAVSTWWPATQTIFHFVSGEPGQGPPYAGA
jgi:hypothetical protein